jgi:MFS family permease
MTIFQSGFILTPRSVAMMMASTLTSFFLVRWGYRWPMLVGTITVVVSLFLLALELPGASIFGVHLSANLLLFAIMSLSGIGIGISAPAANNACIELMPDKVATITGLRGMFRQMGGAVSITITILVLHSIGSMQQAFYIAFVSFGIVMLLSTIAIFAMPSRPCVRLERKSYSS